MSNIQLTNEQRKALSNKKITVEVNVWEMTVLMKLRKYHHGKIQVQVIDDIPVRCEIVGSEMVEQMEEFSELLAQVAKQQK